MKKCDLILSIYKLNHYFTGRITDAVAFKNTFTIFTELSFVQKWNAQTVDLLAGRKQDGGCFEKSHKQRRLNNRSEH